MRKKRLLAVLLSAVVLSGLSGCRKSDDYKVPEFSFSSAENHSYPDSSSDDSSASDESSSEESSSEESSSENNSSEESSSAESSSENSPPNSSSAEKKPENPDNPEEKTRAEYKLIIDPINERTLICEGNTITLTGNGNFKPAVNIAHSESYNKSGDSFTYTATVQNSYTGYGNIELFKSCYARFYVNKGEITLIVNSEAFEANEKAVKNAIDQPLNQVSEYIAINADKAKIAEVLGEITTISNKICEGISNDYDKLRAISRWVSANIYYDYIAYDAGVPQETLTLEYMLKNASSVCGGYSNMTSALAAVQGIKVYNVHGSAVNNNLTFGERDPAYHEWNYAIIDGRVIWIDSGWNSHCYRYRDGRYASGDVTVKYFDINADALSQNHKAKYAEYRDYFALLEE